jgi:hypothetical protein
VSLDKPAFGIPDAAELYLFVLNHASVEYMSEEERHAFEICIEELPNCGEKLKRFSVFLKVFYEGAFAYNAKERVQTTGSYLPKNVAIGAMSVSPAFPGQAGIATGYPYMLEPRFLSFSDTIPVTIRTISRMSSRHQRYGLCFTRCIFVWAGESFEQSGCLDFCSIMPHGGFFYVPGSLADYRKLGGLVYAFGEDRGMLERPAKLHDVKRDSTLSATESDALQSGGSSRSLSKKSEDERMCVICLDADAVMAALPCGHLAFCEQCVELARERPCPVCRSNVENIVKIYV